ncbi:MAG: hypothetical protein LJE65_12815 [Desulfobacteraceae bacterium]|nr:hypothetical protein [Desulfobacteraceae bacterium]
MNFRKREKARACCSMEKERLVDRLADCDAYAKDERGRHICYRAAARESGRRARRCSVA